MHPTRNAAQTLCCAFEKFAWQLWSAPDQSLLDESIRGNPPGGIPFKAFCDKRPEVMKQCHPLRQGNNGQRACRQEKIAYDYHMRFIEVEVAPNHAWIPGYKYRDDDLNPIIIDSIA